MFAKHNFIQRCTLQKQVLTTEWLPWLQTVRGLHLVLKTNCIRQPTEAAAQFILQPQYTNNPQNICEGNALQSAVRSFHALNANR